MEIVGEAVKILVGNLLAMTAEEIKLVRGFKKDLKHQNESLVSISAFLDDAHRRQVEEKAIKVWLEKLEKLAWDAEIVLGEISYENLRGKVERKPKGCSNITFYRPLAFRWKMAHKIQDLNVKFNNLNVEADRHNFCKRVAKLDSSLPKANEACCYTDDPVFVGRENDVSKLVKKITSPLDEVISVFPIVGMGGLGKTTLARKIFKHQSTQNHFDKRIWTCVPNDFDVTTLFPEILKELEVGDFAGKSLQESSTRLRDVLEGKRYLLILDDLWNESIKDWEEFENTLRGVNPNKGNVIIVTTRRANVASIVNPYEKYDLQLLNNDECWSIIKAKTFRDKPVPIAFESAGRGVARQCRGVPLAAKMIGGALAGKEVDQWNSIKDIQPTNLEGDGDSSVMDVLKISYNRLPSSLLKACFAYCSIFKKDETLSRDLLIQMWMGEGLLPGSNMETTGNRIFQILMQNSFFQEPEDDDDGDVTCKMHDLVHDLACSVSNSVDRGRGGDVIPRVQYLNIIGKEAAPQIAKENTSYLRTLIFRGRQEAYSKLCKNLQGLKNLRTLILEVWKGEKDCLNSIAKMIHLRFVSLSYVTMLGDSVFKLYNLQSLYLVNCPDLEEIPMIGHLPLLKKLRLICLFKVRSIKPSFYGESSTSSNVTRVSFPALKSLEIEGMENLTEWTEAAQMSGVKVFPCLEYFSLSFCRNLTIIPSLQDGRASLKTLKIQNCRALEKLADDIYDFRSLEALDVHRWCNKLQLRIDQKLHCPLRSLKIHCCDAVRLILEGCTSLQHLELEEIDNVTWLSELSGMESLQFLGVTCCSSFPKLTGMGRFNSLRELEIGNSNMEDQVKAQSSFYEFFDAIECIKSLEKLYIFGEGSWISLPDKIQHLTSLKTLWIQSLGIEALPDWLGNLSSLEELKLSFCERLMKLPSQETMRRLTKLSFIKIHNCEGLASELPKISHIPRREIHLR